MIAEITCEIAFLPRIATASMRPRSDDRGNEKQVEVQTGWNGSFNEAAIR